LQHDYGIGAGARLAKLVRSDHGRARLAARDDLWSWGVAQLPGELRRRDWYRALGTCLRLLGVLRGFTMAIALPVRDGHFRPRNSSS
jgi:hypothetical protein